MSMIFPGYKLPTSSMSTLPIMSIMTTIFQIVVRVYMLPTELNTPHITFQDTTNALDRKR
jgi:uncharacterized membrane protein